MEKSLFDCVGFRGSLTCPLSVLTPALYFAILLGLSRSLETLTSSFAETVSIMASIFCVRFQHVVLRVY